MKYLVVLVFLLGVACGTEEEETSLQELVELEDDDFSMASRQADTGTTPVTFDPMLIIGNIIAAISNVNTTGIDATIGAILGPLLPVGALAGLKPLKLGALTPLLALDGLVASIPSLLAIPVNIANMILPIIGLVLLIIFLIDGGDFGSLLGVGRSLSMPTFSSFDLVNNPVVESISEMFFQAMEKYDE